MISLTVEKRYGTATVRFRVLAPSAERTLELCGRDARPVLPPHGVVASQVMTGAWATKP